MEKTELALITMPKEQAAEKWKESIEQQKQKDTKEIREMKTIYHQLSKGKVVIDLFETMSKVGLNADGNPRLAIVGADRPKVIFNKHFDGKGTFDWTNSWKYRSQNELIQLPTKTFPSWPTKDPGSQSDWSIINHTIEAPRPSIPPEVCVKVGAEALHYPYFVLWEVDKWEPVPPKDPLLLRRVTTNIFVIIAKWNLTKLERAVMRGKL